MRWLRATTLLTAAAAMAAAGAPARAADRAPFVTDTVRQAIEDLDGAIAALARERPTPATADAMRRVQSARTRLQVLAGDAVPPRDAMHPRGPDALADPDFDALLGLLRQVAFPKDRLGTLREAARRARFRTDQVRRVVALFDSGADKVEAAAMLYPRTLDRGRFFEVPGDLPADDDRAALKARMDEADRVGLPPADPGGPSTPPGRAVP